MATKLIKFIVLRPRGIPQNLEVNCGELIKNIKNKLFSEDIKKELNVRLIYMGKILEDKKKLEDYLNYYQKDIFSNKSTSLINDNKKDGQNDMNTDACNKKNSSNDYKENIIPITIHVKITEKSTPMKSDNIDGKNMNTAFAQLTLVMFVSLLWMYRYNYMDTFPVFSSVVLFIFTIFILSVLFHKYIMLLFRIIFKIIAVICQLFKHYFTRLCTYILRKSRSFF
ncbi:conserved Plasmodium protein, unknown function [Plasmodium ovale]|uniref:Ubiquitin-like domain-containing protein n=1 Tax=Plasmodium ovale TaxID=36330 RepID=A0A1D3TI26_PLAOA|nr:conserved Plasmodium protein, unknown function [Plasmodium ovale]